MNTNLLEFIKKLDNCSLCDAIVLTMEHYKINVKTLVARSKLSYDTIVGYRTNKNPPTRISLIQLCFGMRVPYCVSITILKKLGIFLGAKDADNLYAYFLENSSRLDVYDCNKIIDDYNKNIYFLECKALRFKEPKEDPEDTEDPKTKGSQAN